MSSNKDIFKNISFNFIIKVITYLFSFITLMYATRVLQPEIYGRISFVHSFSGYFVMVAGLGMPLYAMRCCAEHKNNRESLNRVFMELWSINIVLSFFSLFVLLILVVSVPKLHGDMALFIVFGSGILFQMIGCEWLYRGLEKFSFLAVSMLVCKIISFAGIILFVRSENHYILYAVFSVLTAYGSDIICFLVLRRHVDYSLRLRINKKHFKPLIVFSMMSFAVSIYSSLDMSMLGFMKTEYETGLYSLAVKGQSILRVIGGIVFSSVLPTATRLWKAGDKEQFESLAKKSYVGVGGIQFVVTVLALVFGKEIILVLGGQEYLGSVDSFMILMLTLVPIGASNIIGGQILIPAGKEDRLLTAELVGAGFNFIANLILIPVWSIRGAALTTVVSEVLVWLICLCYAKKDLEIDLGICFVFKVLIKFVKKTKRLFVISRIYIQSKVKGDKLPFYCPCCNTYLKSFSDNKYYKKPEIYNPARYEHNDQNVICPVCGSLPRHRILVTWLDRNVDWLKDKKVLHFAQEKSLKLWMDRHKISYVTADLFNKADLKLNIEDTGLDDSSWDMIICNHVLEHVSDYKKALHELYRILTPEGKMIISFPVDKSYSSVYEDPTITKPEDCVKYFGQRDHLRVFGRDSTYMLEDIGFCVEEIDGEKLAAVDHFWAKIKPVVGPADYDSNVLYCASVIR